MIKKFLLALLLTACIFNVNISAQSDIALFSIDSGEEFYVYGSATARVAEILGFPESELDSQCINNSIHYLAVNQNNTKQIRLVISQNDFTGSVINISGLSNDSITALLPQIVGIEGVKGEIADKNGQKFIKTELRSSDNGGDYILTEYITVAGRKSFILSFYTAAGEDTGYIDKVFESYNSVAFINENEQDKSDGLADCLIPAFTIVFGAVALFISTTIIIDICKKHFAEKKEQNGD